MIVLDTHIWLNWIIKGIASLPSGIASEIENDGCVAVSAISCFEVALLATRGTVKLEAPIDRWIEEALGPSRVECLPVSCEIAQRSVALPLIHKDPSDRIIIATALSHGARLASLDSKFPLYGDLAGLLVSS
ncbi:MAG: type II toxin-antitoxin system VapC family toxin [Rhodocyclaceae bacterium]|nr:type II toxin-antitoxin system VapC family toxin [Rhodocyclaceae bacterium]